MITEETVRTLVEGHIRGSGIFLVDVVVKQGNAIRVHVDTPEGISIDRCVEISRYLNGQLDRDVEDYSLEVSSPGVGSPFRVKQQYEKNTGRKVEVSLKDGIRLEGTLEAVSDKAIVLKVRDQQKEVSFGEIKKTVAIISFN
jgi:ribosome maturation factor RimP